MKKISVFSFLSLSAYFCITAILQAAAAPSIPLETVPQDAPLEIVKHIERLYSENVSIRLEAVNALAEMGAKASAALPFLKAMNNDTKGSYIGDKVTANKATLSAIVKISKSHDAIAILKSALKYKPDKNSVKITAENAGTCITGEDMREEAARQLGILKEQSAVDDLIEAADDEDPYVRSAAIEALGAIKAEKAVKKILERKNDNYIMVISAAEAALKNISTAAENNSNISANNNPGNEFYIHPAFNNTFQPAEHKSHFIHKTLKETNDSKLKTSLLEAMFEEKDTQAVELAIKMAFDSNPPVRLCAIKLLSNHDTSCVDIFKKAALNDDDPAVRLAAVSACYKMGANLRVEVCRNILKKPNSNSLRSEAVEILKNIKTPEAADAVIEAICDGWHSPIAAELENAASSFDDPAVAAKILAHIKNKKIKLNTGLQILSGMKTSSGACLMELLDYGDKTTKYICITSLGKIKYAAAREKLETIFQNDSDDRARGLAAAALLELDTNGGQEYIDKFLINNERQIQKAAVEYLATHGGRPHTAELIDLLKTGFNNDNYFMSTENKLSVGAALEKTVKLDDTVSISLLVKTLSAANGTARTVSAKTLERIGWQPSDERQTAIYYIASGNYFVCSRLNGDARAHIHKEAMLGMPSLRPFAVSAMKYMNDTVSVDILIKLLYDDDEKVAQSALTAMNGLKDERILRAYTDYLVSGNHNDLKYCAAMVMLESGNNSVIKPIRELINKKDFKNHNKIYDVRKKLAEFIASDPGSIGYILNELHSGDESRIFDIINGFDGPVKNDSIKKAMVQLLSAGEFNRRRIAKILNESGWKPETDTQEVYYDIAAKNKEALRANSRRYCEILIKELKNADTKAKKSLIIHALVSMQEKIALTAFINITGTSNDNFLKLEAVRALGLFKDASAAEALIKCLSDDNLISDAINSLARIGDERAVEAAVTASNKGKISNWSVWGVSSKFNNDSANAALKNLAADESNSIRSLAIDELKKRGITYIFEEKTKQVNISNSPINKTPVSAAKPAAHKKPLPRLILPPGDDEKERLPVSAASDNFEILLEKAIIEGRYCNDSSVKILIKNFAGRLPGRLVPFLFCGNDNLDETALYILNKIGWKPRTEIEEAARMLAARDYKSLQDAPPAAGRFYIAEISDEYSPLRKKAAWCLGEIKPPPAGAAKKIAAAIFSGDFSTRIEMIETLGKMEDSEAVNALSIYAQDEESGMQEYALEALGKIKGTSQVELLIKLLDHQYWRIREYAAIALANTGDSRAVEPLIKALGDEDEEAAAAAGIALIRISGSEISKTVFKKIQDTIKNGDSDAARKLSNAINEKQLIIDLETDEAAFKKKPENGIIEAQNELPADEDTAAIELLATKLRSHSFETRVLAAKTLDKLNWSPRTPAEETRYRFALQDMDALSKIEAETAADVLIEESRMDGEIRKAKLALEALGFVKCGRARKHLLDIVIKSYSWSDRPTAFKALLNNYGSLEIEAIAKKFKEETDNSQKRLQAEFLSKIIHPAAIKALRQAVSDKDSEIRRFALTSISGGTDEAGLAELKKIASKDSDASVRLAALVFLAGRGGKAAAAMLDEHDLPAAQAAIAAIDDEVFSICLTTLENFLSNDNRCIRTSAAEALEKFKWTPVSDNLKAYYCFARNATDEILAHGPGPMKILAAEMCRKNSPLAADLVEFLRECSSKEACEAFMELLKSPDARLCAMAISALGDIKYIKAETAIREILDKNDSYAMSFMKYFYDQYDRPEPFIIKTQFEAGKAAMLRAAAIEALYSITGAYCGKTPRKYDKPPKARAIFRIQKIKFK